uniref:Uncharacterized protein TCIL3000_11_16740 n=1 Tax=Trypanosoma congolense (strain IL3000) TaxID=1068625 RepID=G0V3D7_TRYCI|nr:unnamed protein product [Trypanosoma congolense IL3000]
MRDLSGSFFHFLVFSVPLLFPFSCFLLHILLFSFSVLEEGVCSAFSFFFFFFWCVNHTTVNGHSDFYLRFLNFIFKHTALISSIFNMARHHRLISFLTFVLPLHICILNGLHYCMLWFPSSSPVEVQSHLVGRVSPLVFLHVLSFFSFLFFHFLFLSWSPLRYSHPSTFPPLFFC